MSVLLQYLLPHHLLSQSIGRLAESRHPLIKNTLIRLFLQKYAVNTQEARQENPYAYDTFNDFFIRKLKPELRPVCTGHKEIASPVDGTIAQIGAIHGDQLLQAKGSYFDLPNLLADRELAVYFNHGNFATIYLAPHNYHRIHMPLTGTLLKTIYVPGRLFSVNRVTTEKVAHLYARNERLICIFSTAAGQMAVILVGAMIVGSMKTVWMPAPIRAKELQQEEMTSTPWQLNKGDELGYFKMGSTVILLFAKNSMTWCPQLHPETTLKFGESIAAIN